MVQQNKFSLGRMKIEVLNKPAGFVFEDLFEFLSQFAGHHALTGAQNRREIFETIGQPARAFKEHQCSGNRFECGNSLPPRRAFGRQKSLKKEPVGRQSGNHQCRQHGRGAGNRKDIAGSHSGETAGCAVHDRGRDDAYGGRLCRRGC